MHQPDDFTSPLELFPLETTPEDISEHLFQALWSWNDCTQCQGNDTCLSPACPWMRRAKLQTFLAFYKKVTSWSSTEQQLISDHALRDHEDLLRIINLIREKPSAPKDGLMQEHFSSYGQAKPEPMDQSRAFDLAIRILTMVSCSVRSPYPLFWPDGFEPIVWYRSNSALEFMALAIPRADDHPMKGSEGAELSARQLEHVHGLHLVGTEDLRKHLLLNAEAGTLHVYHFAGFLKEWLKTTNVHGSNHFAILPHQLLFETLHSLQCILFPAYDIFNKKLLKEKKWEFECMGFRDDDEAPVYHYWGPRWRILIQEIRRRKLKRQRLCMWLTTKKAIKLLMLAVTVFGVLSGIVYGTAQLVVSARNG